jgi:hypothetical protein
VAEKGGEGISRAPAEVAERALKESGSQSKGSSGKKSDGTFPAEGHKKWSRDNGGRIGAEGTVSKTKIRGGAKIRRDIPGGHNSSYR